MDWGAYFCISSKNIFLREFAALCNSSTEQLFPYLSRVGNEPPARVHQCFFQASWKGGPWGLSSLSWPSSLSAFCRHRYWLVAHSGFHSSNQSPYNAKTFVQIWLILLFLLNVILRHSFSFTIVGRGLFHTRLALSSIRSTQLKRIAQLATILMGWM